MSWSDEMADVFAESQTNAPRQILAPVGALSVQTYTVVFDYHNPLVGLDVIDAAMRVSGHLAFTMARADFAAAGIAEETLIARAADPAKRFVVNFVEDDEALPFVRVTAKPLD